MSTMKLKSLVSAAALAAVMAAPAVFAADSAGNFGVGVNHAIGEDTSAVSARYWVTNDAAVQGTGYYHKDDQGSQSLRTYEAAVKGIFAPVVRENSKFLVSLEGGYGQAKLETPAGENKANNWFVMPALGAEFMMSGLPELGLNFEVGYRYQDSNDLDTKSQGVVGTVGAIYYF